MFTVTVTGDKALIARLNSMPSGVRQALNQKIHQLVLILLNVVQQKLRGPVLNYITGKLFRSIQPEVTGGDTSITARVYSSGDVKYAAIHEFGGTIPAHEIVATKAQALHFVMNGKEVFFKRVQIPTIHMPEKSYMRSSLDEQREAIVEGMREAVMQGLRQ